MLAKTGRAAAVTALALAVSSLVPVPALADRPMRLDSQVTDRVDALGSRRAEVDAALARLRGETSLQLFVVYVRSFSGTPARRWADETATRSDLGTGDGLLAVATGDRAYAYSFAADFKLTDAQLAEVAEVAIEPALASNDWAGAAVGAAEGYRAALAGRPVTAPNIVPGDPDPGGGTPRPSVAVLVLDLLAVLAVLALAFWLWRRVRRRGPAQPAAGLPAGPPQQTTEELSHRADALLVELDNALATSSQELEVATGQYGPEATGPFAAALSAARQDVAEAFRVRQLITESTTVDEETQRGWLTEIIRRCEAADQRLDAQSAAFDALRQLEANAEQALATAQGRRGAVQARLPQAAETLHTLQDRYGGPALAAVSSNVTEAQGRVGFATEALARAERALAESDRAAAAVAVRGAEEALGQATTLVDALEKVSADLDEAQRGLDALLAEVDSDIAAGRAALDAGGASGAEQASLAAAVDQAEAAAAAVRAELAGPEPDRQLAEPKPDRQLAAAKPGPPAGAKPDPLAALRRLREADDGVDRALAGVRDAAERARRARAMLDQTLLAARAEISAAADFIATRRGAVGSEARTRLAEAQRHLDLAVALAGDDPVAALAEAQQADALAEQAARMAHSDVDRWPVGAGGYGRHDPFGGFAGAVLGGILLGGMGGGSRHGGGWGGGWSPGSFGGTGTRARRGGGGRF
ncbi:MAG TPA: TPM domain-containing protein [Micromonosporaceae bacterium]|nr:TPM domain-containing protein [Micromonosporaceae bacterium]